MIGVVARVDRHGLGKPSGSGGYGGGGEARIRHGGAIYRGVRVVANCRVCGSVSEKLALRGLGQVVGEGGSKDGDGGGRPRR